MAITSITSNQNYVVPAGKTSIIVYAIGGGGGGSTNNTSVDGGGGGGAFASKTISVSGGQTYACVVGAGGAVGFNGGDTIFGNNLVVAKGGVAGGSSGTGGAGGPSASSVGDTKYSGGAGGNGVFSEDPEWGIIFNRGGGGGGAAGSGGAGTNAGGSGGGAGNTSGTYDGGAGGNGGNPGNGLPGSIPGGGGGGGANYSTAAAGARGQIWIDDGAGSGGGDTTNPIITTTANVSVAENSTAIIQSMTANESVTWSIVGGADQSKFRVASTGALRWAVGFTPDYEDPQDSDGNNTYVVQVRATDTSGNWSNQTKTITVTNVNESATAPTITSVQNQNVDEGEPFSMSLAADQSVTWSKVGGADQALFTLSGNTLSMTAKDYEAPADSNGDNIYEVTMRATNSSSLSADKTFNITVDNVAEGGGGGGSGTTDWKYPSSAASLSYLGSFVWSNPTNISADDGQFASTGNFSSNTSQVLRGYNFGFTGSDIPAGATITKVEVEIEHRASGGGSSVASFNLVTLTNNGSTNSSANRIGSNFSNQMSAWSSGDILSHADLITDLPTRDQLVSSNFGVELLVSVSSGSGSKVPAIDFIRVRVTYEVPPPSKKLIAWARFD